MQERVDRDLVGRVEDARRGAARARRGAGEPQGREGVVVDGLEGERPDGRQVERLHGDVDALGVVQRVADRDAHVGIAEVRQRGTVAQHHVGVDDRLRVHDDVDALVGRPEQVVGLDELEALVHERRGVDRDLAAHRPGGVLEGLLDGDRGKLGTAAAAERAPARRQDEPLDGPGALAVEELVQRRVLGVHGDDPRAGRLRELHDELAADDERLLVGEREVDALAERRDRRAEAGGADERVQDEVGAGLDDEPDEPLRPCRTSPSVQASAARAPASASASAIRSTPCSRACATSVSHERSALRPTSSRSSRPRDDVERLRADRAGRSQDEKAASHGVSVASTDKARIRLPAGTHAVAAARPPGAGRDTARARPARTRHVRQARDGRPGRPRCGELRRRGPARQRLPPRVRERLPGGRHRRDRLRRAAATRGALRRALRLPPAPRQCGYGGETSSPG